MMKGLFALRQSSASIKLYLRKGNQQIQPFCRISNDEFIEKRKAYKDHLTDLRKEWTAEFQAIQDRKSEEKRIEIENAVLRKAMRLREKRVESSRRSEIVRINREKTHLAYREHLAKLSVRAAQKDEVRSARFDKLQEYLLAESKHWLTPENYKEKITDDLFKKPCTTGVVDKSSEMWRHYIKPFSLNRVLQQIWEDPAEGDLDSLKTRLEKRAHKTTIRQDGIRHLINGMIGTGHDRERYSELVDGFSAWHEQAEGSERTQHLNKYADDSNFPEISDMTKQDLQDILGNPFDEYENARLKQELDSMLEDGQRLGDEEVALAAGSSGRAKKDFFPVDGDSDSESDSDSDNEKQAVSAKSAPAKAAKKGVARASLRSREEEDEEDPRLAAIANLSEQPVESDDDEEEEASEGGEMFASAESSSVDELIADLAYVNLDDEAALRAMYQKIKLQALNQQKF